MLGKWMLENVHTIWGSMINMFICRNLCQFQRVTARYEQGAKRCSLCACFFETDDIHCPCCNAKLRTKSRHKFRKNKCKITTNC